MDRKEYRGKTAEKSAPGWRKCSRIRSESKAECGGSTVTQLVQLRFGVCALRMMVPIVCDLLEQRARTRPIARDFRPGTILTRESSLLLSPIVHSFRKRASLIEAA